MSEAAPEGGSNTGGETPRANEFKAIRSQEDLNKILDQRLQRERAKFADYDDVRVKAAKLDEIERANQTELEKITGHAKTTESERDAAKAEATRLRVAVSHGISLEDADLFLTGTDEETLTAQAKRLVDREADRKKSAPRVPKEGTSTSSGSDVVEDEREYARNLFSGGS